MRGRALLGVIAAVFAAFSWSLNFVAPYVLGPYSIYDLAVCRFLMSGLMGLVILYVLRKTAPQLGLLDWFVAGWLGFVGYVGYFLTIMGAVLFAGPIVPPAFVALVPVVLALTSNRGKHAIPWTALMFPIALTFTGLLLVNANAFMQTARLSGSTAIGIGFSVGAIGLWTHFAMANRAALAKRPQINAWKWTAAMMVAGSVEILAFVPFGYYFHLLNLPQVGFSWALFAPIFYASAALAAIGSIGGSWAWTMASKRLPIGLAGQLIVTETIFATSFGLMAHHRWPTWQEISGVTLLVIGVVSALRAFYGCLQHETVQLLTSMQD
ncbi:DMT family transporter [Vogesella oryzae]|uniref:DMT family transporter n=1 Tax=Vogesella oryzae TaxID=1735285 RepID=UPI00158378C7|nr:DMT family transporter [Vogesella oryzae]